MMRNTGGTGTFGYLQPEWSDIFKCDETIIISGSGRERGKISGRASMAWQIHGWPACNGYRQTQHQNPWHWRQKPTWQIRSEKRECGIVQLFRILCTSVNCNRLLNWGLVQWPGAASMIRLWCWQQMLRATGKPYHPGCFNCVVCGKNLDGMTFTVDATNQVHCIEDFHRFVVV